MSTEQEDVALPILRKKSMESPNDIPLKAMLAYALLDKGLYAEALDVSEALARLAPSGVAFGYKAQALTELGRIPEALVAVDESLAHQKNEHADYLRRLIKLIEKKNFSLAQTSLLKEAPRIEHDVAFRKKGLFFSALLYLGQGRHDEAYRLLVEKLPSPLGLPILKNMVECGIMKPQKYTNILKSKPDTAMLHGMKPEKTGRPAAELSQLEYILPYACRELMETLNGPIGRPNLALLTGQSRAR